MKLVFYANEHTDIDLRPNPPTREWMDNTAQSYAYRCLPLNIANTHGWSFHLPFDLEIFWDGGDELSSIRMRAKGANSPAQVAVSDFGHGILTFYIHGVFRTEPGWNIYISGAPNRPIDGLYPLHGVVETDWSPYSFTMNWQITRAHEWLKMPKDFPFCSIMPVQRHMMESVEPEMRLMKDNAELFESHETWSKSRQQFNDDLGNPDSDAVKTKWQKNYYQGKLLTGEDGTDDHKIKLRIQKFKDLRKL